MPVRRCVECRYHIRDGFEPDDDFGVCVRYPPSIVHGLDRTMDIGIGYTAESTVVANGRVACGEFAVKPGGS